jgi:dynein heavy chain
LPDEAKKFGKTDQAFKKIMETVFKAPNVLQACVKADNGARGDDLRNIAYELDRCQKSLTNYLETKQMSFPRFYFISNDDLLQILGSSDPLTIQPFLLSLFDGCKRLIFENNNKVIVGMESDEGEIYRFETVLKPEGKIEEWMNKVDEEMKATLKTLTKKAVFHYARSDRIEWIESQIGMVALAGTQIWWTFSVEDTFNRVAKGDKHALKDELKKETEDLNNLIALVRTDIGPLLRKATNTLIILDVHARDIVDGFVRDSIMSAKEFAWESQLRFYWDNNEDDLVIRQCTGTFFYCYEYQGLNGRLVITPLTDRCVMTLTTALTFYLGGAPAGPAGTGKTETVKDLAKGLALRCVVTNCGETLDSVAMSIIFSGLIQTGFWGCFDEFNRINLEVLSVVSEQIQCIQMGLIKSQKKLIFQETEMRLIPSIGIFITMNPGYAGRSELPDNLKALFRPVTMVVPNLQMICENMLMSEGFTQAKPLSVKMTTLYKLSKEQLSKQYHYDFGLRALKSVLVMAGQLKRNYSELPEDIVLMRALRDMNMPKFVFEDVPLFQGLINDLFPGIKADRVGYEDLNKIIIDIQDAAGNHFSDEDLFLNQVDKVV